jgi:flagellar hook assembly protein FlgD
VKLSVFNILGQLVATLVNGQVEAGYQAVEWNTDNSSGISLPSGIYIYRIDATSSTSGKSFSQVKKMVLMK